MFSGKELSHLKYVQEGHVTANFKKKSMCTLTYLAVA